MIGYLHGVIRFASTDTVCIDVGGVGYTVAMPLKDIVSIGGVGKKAEVFIHTHVREDAILLYGFLTPIALTLFERLIGVSGVGPKVALALLSGLGAQDLVHVIIGGDEDKLTDVPGIGKKIAARLVLELKDKFAKDAKLFFPVADAEANTDANPKAVPNTALLDDLRSALNNLGYKPSQVDKVMTVLKPKAAQGATLDALLKEALALPKAP